MRKGQLTIIGFIISFLILVLVFVLLPVIKVFIDNTLSSGQFSTGSIEYYGILMFPILMVIGAILTFFAWNAVRS